MGDAHEGKIGAEACSFETWLTNYPQFGLHNGTNDAPTKDPHWYVPLTSLALVLEINSPFSHSIQRGILDHLNKARCFSIPYPAVSPPSHSPQPHHYRKSTRLFFFFGFLLPLQRLCDTLCILHFPFSAMADYELMNVVSVGGNPVSAFLSWRLQATNACDVTLVWKSNFQHVADYGISFK